MAPSAQVETWGETSSGRPVELITLTNERGSIAKFTNLGAVLTELWTPDRQGNLGNVALGFDQLGGYLGDHPYLGSTLGRFANRIGDARFALDGIEYRVTANEGTGQLHGGVDGFHRKVWEIVSVDGQAVELRLVSPDGDEGFPGNLETIVKFTFDAGGLRIDYSATADAPTPVNLTNHSYFNLACSGTVLDHVLELAADHYTPTDAKMIPTGEIAPVDDTGLDFRSPTVIGDRIDRFATPTNGYDHNYVLRHDEGALGFAARVTEPGSGRMLEVWTTEPGLQLYTGNWLDGSLVGAGGFAYPEHGGLCLETQHFPDSVNQPDFPSTVLRPGQRFESTTEYRLGVVDGPVAVDQSSTSTSTTEPASA